MTSCSQSTMSRLENLPDVRALLRLGRTPEGLLRHVVYLDGREDKPAIEVRRDRP